MQEARETAAIEAEAAATSGRHAKRSFRRRSGMSLFLLVAILSGAFLLYANTLRPDSFGFYHDDGIYLVTAKALAEGHGYRIISLPYEPAQTKYPPLYPLLLSLGWRAYPQFPANLPFLMMLSAVTAIGFLALSYRYLVGWKYATEWQALLIVLLAAINWRTIILATSIYSEMLYAALAVLALHLAEGYDARERRWPYGLLVGVVMGLACLARSLGVALPISVGLYYLLRRRWKKAILPVGVAGLMVLAWVVWCQVNRTAAQGTNVAYYTNYWGHIQAMMANLQAANHASLLWIYLGIIAKNLVAMVLLSIPLVCLGLSYEGIQYFGFAFLFVAAGFVRQVRKGWRLLHVYLLCYLVIGLPVPYTSYDRYLMPLIPFLLLFLIIEFNALIGLVKREWSGGKPVMNKVSAAIIGLALVVAAGLTFYNYASEIYLRVAAAKRVAGPPHEDAEVIDWIKAETKPSDVLVCDRDPTYYLYTGRKTTRSVPMNAGVLWLEQQSLITQIAHESDARYLVFTPADFGLEYQPELGRERFKALLEQHPRVFTPVFTSADGRSLVFRIESNSP
jgi:hypothetical protein